VSDFHSQRVFPRAIVPGSRVLIRKAVDGGWFTDAGTVARGKHNRVWCTVTAVEARGSWYIIRFADDAPLDKTSASANSKLIALAPKPVSS
jgi:hypothetical protein